MNLSKHFTEQEFCRSSRSEQSHIDNKMNDEQRKNAVILCNSILEPIRVILDRPLIITSGFRCPELNQLIGSKPTSQHCKGQAADFIVQDMNLKEAFNKIINMNLGFDQLIWEFGEWIHISYSPRPRKEVLKATKINNTTIYQSIIRI